MGNCHAVTQELHEQPALLRIWGQAKYDMDLFHALSNLSMFIQCDVLTIILYYNLAPEHDFTNECFQWNQVGFYWS